MAEKRFEVISKDGSAFSDEGVFRIVVDRETGVNYIVWKSGYAGAITPLLNAEGNVVKKKFYTEI